MAYNPSDHKAQNQPFGVGAIPLNAKSLYYDATNFKYRPFVNVTEVNSYFSNLTFRDATFDIIVNTGGTLLNGVITGGTNAAYWYRDGTDNNDLMLKTNSVDLEPINAAIAALQNGLINESSARLGGELALELKTDDMITNFGDADDTLQTNIDSEETARINADATKAEKAYVDMNITSLQAQISVKADSDSISTATSVTIANGATTYTNTDYANETGFLFDKVGGSWVADLVFNASGVATLGFPVVGTFNGFIVVKTGVMSNYIPSSQLNIVEDIPEARPSGITDGIPLDVTNLYFGELSTWVGTNRRFRKLFVYAYGLGTFRVAFYTLTGSNYVRLGNQIITVTVIGLQELDADDFPGIDLSFPGQPLVYVGLLAITAGVLKYNTNGEINSGISFSSTATSGAINSYNNFELPYYIEVDTVISFENLYNNDKNLTQSVSETDYNMSGISKLKSGTYYYPEDRSAGLPGGTPYNSTLFFMEKACFVDPLNQFYKLHVYANIVGTVSIGFFKLTDSTFTRLATQTLTLVGGDNVFTASSFPGIETYLDTPDRVTIGIRNITANILNFEDDGIEKGGLAVANTSSGNIFSTNSYRFALWLEGMTYDNSLIVDEFLSVKQTLEEDTVRKYEYEDDYPLLPKHIYFADSLPTALFKKSMYQLFKGATFPDIVMQSSRTLIPINDPTYLTASQVQLSVKMFLDKNMNLSQLLYKDVKVLKAITTGLSGTTLNITWDGDSLIEGGNGFFNTAPIYFLTPFFQAYGITVNGIGAMQRTSGSVTQQYNGQGGWRYRTKVGLEARFSAYAVTLPSPTKRVYVEGVDGDMLTIKAHNYWLYEATAQDKIDYPEWCFNFVSGATGYSVSYLDNPSLGTYYIYSPARYQSERGIPTPDVYFLDLGTNEYYLPSWDLDKALLCAEWMIRRLRQAMPLTKIVVVPSNNIPLSLDADFGDKPRQLASGVAKIVEDKIAAGDTRMFTLSIFAHCSRLLAYSSIDSTAELSTINSTKVATINDDVHNLTVDDDSRKDWIDAVMPCLLCMMTN